MSAETLRQAFREQAESCAKLGSSFTARICRVAAEFVDRSNAVGRQMLDWPGDPRSNADSVPLRFAGALHALVIGGMDDELGAIYPPNAAPESDRDFWQILWRAVQNHQGFVLERLQSAPQTNEIRRSVGLYSGLACVAEEFGLPISLSELGASAGLNLFCDRFAFIFAGQHFGDPHSGILLEPKWSGNLPPIQEVAVEERQGCDLNPLDIRSETDMARLKSYLWPDQPDRAERTANAIALARQLMETDTTLVKKQDAADWLEKRLAERKTGLAHVVQHSIAFQYFPNAVQERCRKAINRAGERATRENPLAWLSMEADDDVRGALLKLQTWPGGPPRQLARIDFHGRWVDWLM